jgi:hypothetical protein
MLAFRWIAAASFCALIGCASKAPPASPLSEQWVETELPQVGVKFSRPVAWKVVENSDRGSVHFAGVDGHSTQVGLMSVPAPNPQLTPEQRLTETMEAYRVPSNVEVVLEDSRRQIAGCPASIFTTEGTKTGFKVRVMLVHFYSPRYDYRLSVAGEADFFDDVRPKVMKMIDSMRLIELKKDSN